MAYFAIAPAPRGGFSRPEFGPRCAPPPEEAFLTARRARRRMRMSAPLKKALTSQIGMEAYASNYYLAMASWCELAGYEGSASMLYRQADEERAHMNKIVRYLNMIGAGAAIPAVKQPPAAFKDLESVFKAALKSEQAVTASFNSMAAVAQKDGDHAAFAFLQWFVTEQVEEEALMETILQKFDLLGRDKIGIYEADRFVGRLPPPGGPAAAAAPG